ncbi:MAG TPA: RibD family protein [Thermoanaerobaculia bacterium]|nr:RibD family protein [Thermoanaerobaculia bacterium]
MSVSILTASSLNGVITAARGRSGEELVSVLEAPRRVLEWKYEVRRRHDAVLVGTNTVLVDNPSLRSHVLPGVEGVRASVDPLGRIPRHSRLFDGAARTLVGVNASTPEEYLDFLDRRGVEAVPCGGEGGRCDLRDLLGGLARKGVRDVAVEGGGELNRALLDADLVDRLYVMLMPAVLDSRSVRLFEEGGTAPVRFRLEDVERAGDFLLLSLTRTARSPGVW